MFRLSNARSGDWNRRPEETNAVRAATEPASHRSAKDRSRTFRKTNWGTARAISHSRRNTASWAS